MPYTTGCTTLANLGVDLKAIRTTTEETPRYSVYDVINSVIGDCRANHRMAWLQLIDRHPEVIEFTTHFKFHGQGQRNTPVCTEYNAVRIVHLLPSVQNDAACDRAGVKRKRCADKAPDDLYVMRYSFRSDILKIGRSANPEKRRREMETCHAFNVELVTVFPGKGWCERLVHGELNDVRNREGAGQEWFHVTPELVLKIVEEICGCAA